MRGYAQSEYRCEDCGHQFSASEDFSYGFRSEVVTPVVLAVSTDCVATAWDMSEPLNQIYAGAGGGPEAAARGAIAAAGPYANDLQVRCTWWPRDEPEPPVPPAPGSVLTARLSS